MSSHTATLTLTSSVSVAEKVMFILLVYIIVLYVYCNEGTLCGECWRERHGVSALLNQCVSCSDISILLILALGKIYTKCSSSIVTHDNVFSSMCTRLYVWTLHH